MTSTVDTILAVIDGAFAVGTHPETRAVDTDVIPAARPPKVIIVAAFNSSELLSI